MELAYLRQKWRSRADGDPAASISAWDSVAQDYVGDVAPGPRGAPRPRFPPSFPA